MRPQSSGRGRPTAAGPASPGRGLGEPLRSLQQLRRSFPFLPSGEGDVVAVLPEALAPADVLARLGAGSIHPRADLVGSSNREGGSGGQLGIFLEVGDEFLKTARDRCYPDARRALEGEWDAEVRRQELGVYHPGRAFFLVSGAAGGVWACSLTPRLTLLRERFNRGPEAEAWQLYLEAFRMTFELARREAVLLDCNPNNFGIAGNRLYYLDDDLAAGTGRMPFGHQLLLRLREYEQGGIGARLEFLRGFLELAETCCGDERIRGHLLQDLEPRFTWPREPELRAVLEQLIRKLSPPRKTPR